MTDPLAHVMRGETAAIYGQTIDGWCGRDSTVEMVRQLVADLSISEVMWLLSLDYANAKRVRAAARRSLAGRR